MTAFHTAWSLLKMPLVRDSIEEVTPRRFTATFQDRYDPNITHQMVADAGNYHQHGMEIGVGGEDEFARAAFRGYPEDGGWWHPADVYVAQKDRRRGISTAMYDLMNEIIQRRGLKGIRPSSNRTPMGKEFWREQDVWPKEGRYE
jgi:GNAT superfamily N-acetyltransferase